MKIDLQENLEEVSKITAQTQRRWVRKMSGSKFGLFNPLEVKSEAEKFYREILGRSAVLSDHRVHKLIRGWEKLDLSHEAWEKMVLWIELVQSRIDEELQSIDRDRTLKCAIGSTIAAAISILIAILSIVQGFFLYYISRN